MKVNLYDFDKTIYDGDSTIDFYLYCLKRNKKIIKFFPIQFINIILYKLHLKNKDVAKEKFFIFLKEIDDVDNLLYDFWKLNIKKMKKWYMEKEHKNDIIISASPYFLLEIPLKRIDIYALIATKVNKKTGKFNSKNCYGIEKVIRLIKEYPNVKVNEAYSDSLSDKPMLELAKTAYLVKKNKIEKIK